MYTLCVEEMAGEGLRYSTRKAKEGATGLQDIRQVNLKNAFAHPLGADKYRLIPAIQGTQSNHIPRARKHIGRCHTSGQGVESWKAGWGISV